MRPVDICETFGRAIQVVRMSTAANDVAIDAELPDSPVTISGMSGQLEQLFVNLVNNAINAMGDDSGFVRIEVEEQGDSVECRIVDDAGGMSEDTVARIFEPFFTTRGASDGTGLGLALVRAIVDRHNGEIDVASEVGNGTTFTVVFPRTEEAT
jgi:two-component system NtrC family sensor kinase